MKRVMWGAAAMTIVAALPGSPASAEDTLIFATTNTPQAEVTKQIYDPWTAEMNKKGEGILKIDQRNDVVIASSRNFYDRVRNDVVQIVFGAPNFVPGKFRNAT